VRTRWIAAAGLAAIGLVWIGQGLGLLRSTSFMVGDVRWAIAGVVLVAAAAIVGWAALRGRWQA
jgi:uncharacterized protein YaaW (UPF0174 family)